MYVPQKQHSPQKSWLGDDAFPSGMAYIQGRLLLVSGRANIVFFRVFFFFPPTTLYQNPTNFSARGAGVTSMARFVYWRGKDATISWEVGRYGPLKFNILGCPAGT